jgi:hypothetical protein
VRESWRGATLDEVAAVWGMPAHSVKDGEQENHTWVTEDRIPRGGGSGMFGGVSIGSGGRVGVGVGVGGAIFGPSGDLARCERTLMFREGKVIGEDWKGDPELCRRFERR